MGICSMKNEGAQAIINSQLSKCNDRTKVYSMKMGGGNPLFLFIIAVIFFNFSQARSLITSTSTEPHVFKSFRIKPNQSGVTARTCSYTLSIKTSCSSPKYTRDKVSIAFGDAYGFEVYAPRLDDPRSKIFESCSTDTFQIHGPCTYEICYLNLLRVGSDGWKPEYVKVYGPDRPVITFRYNRFLPNGVWFGFNHCRKASEPVM